MKLNREICYIYIYRYSTLYKEYIDLLYPNFALIKRWTVSTSKKKKQCATVIRFPSEVFSIAAQWNMSLCAGSTEIHSWVWQIKLFDDQRAFHCVISFYLKPVCELALIVWFTHEHCVPNEAHRLIALLVLVPEHYL